MYTPVKEPERRRSRLKSIAKKFNAGERSKYVKKWSLRTGFPECSQEIRLVRTDGSDQQQSVHRAGLHDLRAPRGHLHNRLDFRRKLRLCSVGQGVDTILEAMAFVIRLGATTRDAAVQPGTPRIFATMALELEANTLVHILRREEIPELWATRDLIQRPDPIFALALSCSVASLSFAFALTFGSGQCC